MSTELLQRAVENALAYAHAAVDSPTPPRVAEARRRGQEALAMVARMRRAPWTLNEASRIVTRVGHLRELLALIERNGTVDPTACGDETSGRLRNAGFAIDADSLV